MTDKIIKPKLPDPEPEPQIYKVDMEAAKNYLSEKKSELLNNEYIPESLLENADLS